LGTWEEVTRKFPEPLAVPPAVVTITPPVVAPGITIATNVLPLLLIGMAETPAIVIPVGLLRLVPVIVTSVPTGPVVAEKEIIVGAGIMVNPASDALPPGVVRLTAPVAPVPTIATIEVVETTVNDVTRVPPNVIIEVPVKFVPVMLMIAPEPALVGAKDVMVGCEKTTELSNNNTEIKKIFFMNLIYARIIIEYNKRCKYFKQPKTIMR
jgi:hypothetical protein